MAQRPLAGFVRHPPATRRRAPDRRPALALVGARWQLARDRVLGRPSGSTSTSRRRGIEVSFARDADGDDPALLLLGAGQPAALSRIAPDDRGPAAACCGPRCWSPGAASRSRAPRRCPTSATSSATTCSRHSQQLFDVYFLPPAGPAFWAMNFSILAIALAGFRGRAQPSSAAAGAVGCGADRTATVRGLRRSSRKRACRRCRRRSTRISC